MTDNVNTEEYIERRVVEEFPKYAVNNIGQVKYIPTGRIRANSIGKRGYCVVSIRKDGKDYLKTIHRFVAKAFIPNPDGKEEVNHIDGDKTNNKVENLEWVTAQENNIHARRTGLHKSDGDKAVMCLDMDGNLLYKFKSISEASRSLNINRSNINQCCLGHRRYKSAGGYKRRFI